MALLFASPISTPTLNSSSASGYATCPFIRSSHKPITLQPKSYVGVRIRAPFFLSNRGVFIVKASSDTDGAESASPDSPNPPSDGNEKSTPVENLPLESKLDQKMRMKMAKKIRLRRKRLVRKRHLRKKGRWPPSKLKKNKNV